MREKRRIAPPQAVYRERIMGDFSSKLASATPREVKTHDGVSIYYEVLGKGDRTLMLASGLGGRLYAWQPLIEALFDEYRFIVWDYRGLFESTCDAHCKLSVRDHAQDGFRILDNEGIHHAAWIGWSMGVQVLLEAASIEPSRIGGLVLLNGTWGHVFSSALQPGLRVPIVTRYMHELVEWVRHHPEWAKVLAVFGKHGSAVTVGVFWLLLGRRAMLLEPMLQQYMADVFNPSNFGNFLKLFQELDAHSAFHHLPDIDVPALVVSGRFDVLTPSYQAREMARRLPRAEHLHVKNGSHFVLIERPEQVVPRIEKFLRTRARWQD